MEKIGKRKPLYDQLVETLKIKIDKELEPNAMLPSERELSEIYGVSRTTVRLALQELEQMGYIYRQHGRGTFVAITTQSATNLAGAYSFTDHMKSLNKNPSTKVINMTVVAAKKFFAEQLNLRLGEDVIKITRLREADGMPMMIERTYLPYALFSDLNLEMIKQKPLYEIIEQDYHQKIKTAEEEFYASIANKRNAEFLEVHEGAPVLKLVRTTYNDKGQVIEFTLSDARSDQFKYKVTHIR